jgi:hypothetical protein
MHRIVMAKVVVDKGENNEEKEGKGVNDEKGEN